MREEKKFRKKTVERGRQGTYSSVRKEATKRGTGVALPAARGERVLSKLFLLTLINPCRVSQLFDRTLSVIWQPAIGNLFLPLNVRNYE